MTLGWPLPIYGKVKFGNLDFSIKECENFETIATCDLESGRCRHIIQSNVII